MPEDGAVLPGALDAARFFGREGELHVLGREALSLARGQGRSRAICARPGSGKSELLRQWHGRVFRAGEILPVWYSVPPGAWEAADAGRDLARAIALQALAFRRRDPSLLARPASDAELVEGVRSAWGEGGLLLAGSLAACNGDARGPGALAAAASLPHRFATLTGTRLLCLIDDAGNLAGSRPGQLWPGEATASALAPALFGLDDESLVRSVCGPAAVAAVTVDRLGPLGPEATARLARHLARSRGLELAEPAVAALVGESGGSPFYLGALVRALADAPGTRTLDVARAAAATVCGGELARYWLGLLADAMPERRTRATALEILAFCLREGDGSPDAARLPALMLKAEADVESALAGLERAGVIRVDCNRIAVDEDPVFRDVVRAHYRREFGRVAPAAVAAALAAEKARGVGARRERLRRQGRRDALAAILGAWAAQQVPSQLFDAASPAPQPGEVFADAAVTALPRVVSVVSGRVGSGLSLPGLEVDALAWGARDGVSGPDAEVVWVARWLAGGADGAEQLARFDRDVAALQGAGELPAARVVRWAVLEGALDAAGTAAAARLRIATSTRPQLEALAGLVGVAAALPPASAGEPEEPAVELEMVIPRVADVELVAARALEQLGENLALDPQVTARVRTALVEACINAFEHGGAPDGRVRLVFAATPRRLEIRVENRGRTLAALPPAARADREARGRGWGLTLIRELVDEVALEPREDGVCLVMVKHLGG